MNPPPAVPPPLSVCLLVRSRRRPLLSVASYRLAMLASAPHRCIAAAAVRSARCAAPLATAAAAAARPALPLSVTAAAATRRSFHSAPVLRGLLDKKEAQEVTEAKKKAVSKGEDERDGRR